MAVLKFETVKVVAKLPGGFMIVNKKDFDKKTQKLWSPPIARRAPIAKAAEVEDKVEEEAPAKKTSYRRKSK